MNKIYLTFTVTDQLIHRTDTQTVVAGSYNVYWARFFFSEAWDGLNKTAVFALGDKNYLAEIDDSGECEVPWEVLADPGSIRVGCNGGTLITTDSAEVIISQSIGGGDYPAEPTEGLIPAAVDATRAYRDAAEQAAKEAAASQSAASESEIKTAEHERSTAAAAAAAKKSEESAEEDMQTSCDAAEKSTQALSDLIAMLGTSVASLVGGKVPMSELPASAIGEATEIQSEDELTTITAQLYDIAYMTELHDGEKTIVKQWQLLGDGNGSNRINWIVCGTSYAVQAGNAATANTAANSVKIDGRRMVHMTQDQYDIAAASGTLDLTADYLVYTE